MNSYLRFIVLLTWLLLFFRINAYAQFHWEQTNGPFGGHSSIIIADSLGNLYGGGYNGIYYSEDNGDTWQFNKVDSIPLQVISICLAANDTIYAGTHDGYYRSPDKMITWEKIEGLWGDGMFSKIAIHPHNGYLYAVSADGLYLSTDKGISWEKKVSETETEISILKVLNSGEVFTGFEFGGILKSIDYGISWIKTDSGYSHNGVYALTEDKQGNIYAGRFGIYKSTDKGDHWIHLSEPKLLVLSITTDEENNLYAAGSSGNFFVSRDNGYTWDTLHTGKNFNEMINTVAVTKNSDIFIHINYIGLLRSTDHGFNWEAVGYPQSRVQDIIVDKKNRVIAGTYDNGPYSSADLGKTWDWLNYNVQWPQVTQVYITGRNDIIARNSSLWFSSDSGSHWNNIGSKFEGAIGGFLLTNVDKIIINYGWGYNHFSSTNFGTTWDTYKGLGNFGTTWSAYEKLPPLNIYICSNSSIFVSEDDGNSWNRRELQNSAVIYSIKSNSLGVLYVGTDKGILKSTDLNIWTNITNGLPEGKIIAVDTYKESGVICTIENKGVFVSSNGGAEWQTIGKTDSPVLKAVADSSGYIYAATEWNGVLRSNIPLEVVSSVKEEVSFNYSLLQNYPNPFNPVTTISYSIPSQSLVELKVYDMLGREVTTLVNKEQNEGEYSVQFNASSLPSGVYVYSLKAGEYKSSRKLVLLK